MKNRYRPWLFLVVGVFFGDVALAQTLGDLMSLVQKSRAVIGNSAMIDEHNTELVRFSSTYDKQLVELSLRAARLNDSFISAINYGSQESRACANGSRNTNVVFGDLGIYLDGCDVTAALYSQCNAVQCWDGPAPGGFFTGTFGTYLNLNLSALNPQTISGCVVQFADQTSFFDARTPQHQLEFRERTSGVGRGGSLFYQVVMYNRTY